MKNLDWALTSFGLSVRLVYFLGVLSTFLLAEVSNAANNVSSDTLASAEQFSVRVKSTIKHAFFEDDAGTHKGAGFLVDKKRGWILTNAHVSGRGNAEVQVAFYSSNFELVDVVYVDPELDLAILRVEPLKLPEYSTEAPLQCETVTLNGAEVAAFGHPHGLNFSASRGIVSRLRTYDGLDWIQTDAAINPGNSGGPLIDLESGKVVGINAMALKKTEGLNFAVPSVPACKILTLLGQGEDPSPHDLPFIFGTNPDTEQHLIVADIASQNASLKVNYGDRLVEVNDTKVETPTEVETTLRGTFGTQKFKFLRDEETYEVIINTKPKKRVLSREYIIADGALISEDPYNDRRSAGQLYQIHSVREGSYAERSGLTAYSQIVSIDGKRPISIENIYELLKGDAPKSIILRGWSSSDNELYEYSEVSYWPYSVDIHTAKTTKVALSGTDVNR
ncbi:trypsin-like peptidase domain-containing protein [Alphaproteobacteria bacterium]|nr:trypsin-like peptidase domain-containing protein [Alphaproteobacteria bacterium]